MRVTTWGEYGLIVAVGLAKRGSGQPVPARDLAEHEGLPVDYVEQICLRLRRAGLVKSVRGTRGGYLLSCNASLVSVRDVLEAAEHRTFEVNCDTHPVSLERCGPDGHCSIRPVWLELHRRIDGFLEEVTLADLLGSEEEVRRLVEAAASSS